MARVGIIAGAAIVVIGAAAWRFWPAPPETVVQSARAPSPAPPPAAAPAASSFKAEDGSIYTDKLFWGLLSLDDSPTPVQPAQATEVLRVLGLLDAKLHKNQFYDQQLLARLRPEQVACLERTATGLHAEEMHQGFNPDRIHAIEDALEALAGVPRPTEPVALPAEVPPLERPLTISRMTAFMLSWDTMQADPALAVDAAQARELLPYVDSYVRLKSMKQQTKRDILAVLDPAQKSWIDTHPARDEEISDMTRLTERVRARMKEIAGVAP